MRRLLPLLSLSVLSSWAAVACEEASEPNETPVSEAPTSPQLAEDECVEGAFRAAQLLGKVLKTRLVEAMAQGVEPAVRVCADEAQAMHRQVADQTGVRVGRTSAKLRNPVNAPPPWVAAYLEEHDASAPPVRARDGDEARVILPLHAGGLCLNCHGESVSDEVQTVLDERYPDDRATGYREGQLRGVIWAEKNCALNPAR